MPKDVIIPALGESIASGILSAWKVKEGSYVEIDQPIYELETDKITQEGLADTAGVISFLAKEGDEVDIGATIAKIDESAEKETDEISAPPATPAAEIDSTTNIEQKNSPQTEVEEIPKVALKTDKAPSPKQSPAVKKLLNETGLNPESISGSGKDGRLTKADVLQASKTLPATPENTTPAPDIISQPKVAPQKDNRVTRRPLSPIRKRIAERLVDAQKTAAILSTFNEVDLSAVMSLRKLHQDSFVKTHGIKLGFMSFFVKAVVHALKAVPALNVRMEGDELVENHYYDISVAVGTEKGLVVPVLRDCDMMSFAQIEQSIINYAEKAKSGSISLEDMQGVLYHHKRRNLWFNAFHSNH